MKLKDNWKLVGLFCSLALEALFWVLYLSLLLLKIGSPFGDVLWLSSGTLGIAFGILNLIGGRAKYIKALAAIALAVGLVQIPLWILAMFVVSM